MRNHSNDLHQPTDSFHDNQTHFYMKGFTRRLVLKQSSSMSCSQEPLIVFFCGAFPVKLIKTYYDLVGYYEFTFEKKFQTMVVAI